MCLDVLGLLRTGLYPDGVGGSRIVAEVPLRCGPTCPAVLWALRYSVLMNIDSRWLCLLGMKDF